MDQNPTTPAAPAAEPQPAASVVEPAATVNKTPVTPPAVPADPATPPTPFRFPIRTVLLILLLALLAGGLLFAALKSQTKNMKQIGMQPTPTVSPAHTTLALVQQTATNGAVLAVTVDTGKNKITGVQLEISFDPSVVSHVTVTPANFLPQPTILLNKVDTQNGRISYAAVLSPTAPAVTGTGTVAIISYTLSPATAQITEAPFKFLPKSKVTEDGVMDSVLKDTKDITLPLPGATTSAR